MPAVQGGIGELIFPVPVPASASAAALNFFRHTDSGSAAWSAIRCVSTAAARAAINGVGSLFLAPPTPSHGPGLSRQPILAMKLSLEN